MYTLWCIHLFLRLYQLIIGGSSPDVKASIRYNPLASPFLFSTLPLGLQCCQSRLLASSPG